MVASLARPSSLAVQSAALARVATDMAECRCGRDMRSGGDSGYFPMSQLVS